MGTREPQARGRHAVLAVLCVVVSVAVTAALFGLAYLLRDVWIVARLVFG
ncbi:hypothetical protein AB0C47_28890 [Micromonospora taraxaci]